MVKGKKSGVSEQKKAEEREKGKKKHEDVPVNPRGQENKDNIRKVGEILGDMQPEGPQGNRNRVETQVGTSSRGSQNRGESKEENGTRC